MSAMIKKANMEESIQIEAPSSVVWKVLMDLEEYSKWNPFFIKAEGTLQEQQKIKLTMQPVEKSAQKFSPKILEVKEEQSIKWIGKVLFSGIFDGEHSFTLEQVSPNKTKFTQYERFSGILVGMANFEPYRAGWKKMNLALKEKAETMFKENLQVV